MSAVRLFAAALLTLALVGCGGLENTDPSKGRVTLDEEGCFKGGCYILYEVCVGPDLHIVYDEAGDDDDYEYLREDAPECVR